MKTVQQMIFDDEVMTAFGGGGGGGGSSVSFNAYKETNGSTTFVSKVGSSCSVTNTGVQTASYIAGVGGAAMGSIAGPVGSFVAGTAASSIVGTLGNSRYEAQYCF